MMKRIAFLLLVWTSVALTAQEKKDILLKTEVSDVTVFIKGAQVIRKTTANFPAGKSTLRFVNLSPYIDAKSVQVKMDGEVMVLSVNHQLNYNDTVKQSDETEQWAKQLSVLNEKIAIEQACKEVTEDELTFLNGNKQITGNEGISFANLKAVSTYYGERVLSLKMKKLETDKKINGLLEEKNAIIRKMSGVGNIKPEPAGEVILAIDCKSAMRVPVELSYYVNNAGWYPSYDIRAKDITQPIDLTYKANIMQHTKEEWKNVKLKVSSANPNLGSVAPKLKPYLLNYYTPAPRYNTDDLSGQVRGKITDANGEPLIGASVTIKGTTIGTAADMDGNYTLAVPSGGGNLEVRYIGYKSKTLPISNAILNIVLEEDNNELSEVVVVGSTNGVKMKKNIVGAVSTIKEQPKPVPVPVVQVENQTSVEFEIKTPYTIPSENKNTTVEVEHYSLPADYEYYCVPKADKDAFLLANISDWEQYNLLEGEANIFFENTFIGKTILDVRAIGDTLNLSLGRDKNISVQREKVKEYSTQKFPGNKTETERDWKITVRNNKRQPITMVLFDQIPVSTTQEIEVNPENISGGGILDKETGQVKWKFTLQPAQKNDLDLRYKVKYPKGRTLTVE